MAEDWLRTPFTLDGKRVWIAGQRGMVGSALTRRLQSENCILLDSDFDLRCQRDVQVWMQKNKPEVVVIAAARVGGILDNHNHPAEFFTDNILIAANIIHAAYENGVEKLLFLGSSCIYPKNSPQPMAEDMLLSGALEPTNEAYALAKVAGIKMCEYYRRQYGSDFISALPCNLYGPGDRFDEARGHVIPALMLKAQAAGDILSVWGSGTPLREFLYVDDLADALVFLLRHYSGKMPVNIGSGEEISIADLADAISEAVGFKGQIVFDSSKPDGVMRKVMDSSRIRAAGWKPVTDLETGLRQTYDWYKTQNRLKDAA